MISLSLRPPERHVLDALNVKAATFGSCWTAPIVAMSWSTLTPFRAVMVAIGLPPVARSSQADDHYESCDAEPGEVIPLASGGPRRE